MARTAQKRFLAEDIWDTPEDGNRYEVIDGQLYVTPPPVERHQRGLGGLFLVVAQHVAEHELGRVYVAPLGVVLTEHDGVQPDLVYVSNERAEIISERGIEGAPDLVVEVLSSSTRARDRSVKMARYAAADIPHYWLLDPVNLTLEAYRLGEQAYELVGTYGLGSTFTPELFPGLSIEIDRLWA